MVSLDSEKTDGRAAVASMGRRQHLRPPQVVELIDIFKQDHSPPFKFLELESHLVQLLVDVSVAST
jgi:hypothetical protein